MQVVGSVTIILEPCQIDCDSHMTDLAQHGDHKAVAVLDAFLGAGTQE
jgi:hypothetical protein